MKRKCCGVVRAFKRNFPTKRIGFVLNSTTQPVLSIKIEARTPDNVLPFLRLKLIVFVLWIYDNRPIYKSVITRRIFLKLDVGVAHAANVLGFTITLLKACVFIAVLRCHGSSRGEHIMTGINQSVCVADENVVQKGAVRRFRRKPRTSQ